MARRSASAVRSGAGFSCFIIAMVLLPGTGAGPSEEVDLQLAFLPPASLHEQGFWSGDFEGTWHLDSDSAWTLQTSTSLSWARIHSGAIYSDEYVDLKRAEPEQAPEVAQGNGEAGTWEAVAPGPGIGGVFMQARGCSNVPSVGLALRGMFVADDTAAGAFDRQDSPSPAIRSPEWGQAGDAAMISQTADLSFTCDWIRLETHGLYGTIHIDGEAHEYGDPGTMARTPNGDHRAGVVVYDVIEARHATLHQEGSSTSYLSVNEPRIDWNGTSHWPLVDQGQAPVIGNATPNGTWILDGSFLVHGIEADERRTRAVISVTDASLLVDGSDVPLRATSDAVVAAAATGVVVAAVAAAWKLAAMLFTRLPAQEALKHPRRQALKAYIEEHPGATFRELVRETDIPAGTCRHHLSVLQRSQVIVEKRHRSTVRFFENHGKFEQSWESVVLLREPELKQVHDWLASNPGAMQKTLLDHAASAWDWSRSTTQHRLKRLVDEEMVDVMEIGRRKEYTVAEPRETRRSAMAGPWGAASLPVMR